MSLRAYMRACVLLSAALVDNVDKALSNLGGSEAVSEVSCSATNSRICFSFCLRINYHHQQQQQRTPNIHQLSLTHYNSNTIAGLLLFLLCAVVCRVCHGPKCPSFSASDPTTLTANRWDPERDLVQVYFFVARGRRRNATKERGRVEGRRPVTRQKGAMEEWSQLLRQKLWGLLTVLLSFAVSKCVVICIHCSFSQ